MHKRLFTPGPTQVRPEILKELATPQIHHRAPEFSELYADIQPKLQTVLSTENTVLLLTSSSTGAMEAAVTNLVAKRCLNLVNGAFFQAVWAPDYDRQRVCHVMRSKSLGTLP